MALEPGFGVCMKRSVYRPLLKVADLDIFRWQAAEQQYRRDALAYKEGLSCGQPVCSLRLPPLAGGGGTAFRPVRTAVGVRVPCGVPTRCGGRRRRGTRAPWRMLHLWLVPVLAQERVLDGRQNLQPLLAKALRRILAVRILALTRDWVLGVRQARGPPQVDQRGLLPRRLPLWARPTLPSGRVRRRGQGQLSARGTGTGRHGDLG
jgi:hypothetical protein